MTENRFYRSHYIERTSKERIGWLDNFADNYSKNEVKADDYSSLYNQINSIVSGKPSFATVADKVKDLQERIGFTEYIKRQANESPLKIFTDKVDFKLQEQIVNFVSNLIETHHGQIVIPAVQHEVLSLFNIDPSEVNSQLFIQFANGIISEKQKNINIKDNDANLGKNVGIDEEIDNAENSDFFYNLL